MGESRLVMLAWVRPEGEARLVILPQGRPVGEARLVNISWVRLGGKMCFLWIRFFGVSR